MSSNTEISECKHALRLFAACADLICALTTATAPQVREGHKNGVFIDYDADDAVVTRAICAAIAARPSYTDVITSTPVFDLCSIAENVVRAYAKPRRATLTQCALLVPLLALNGFTAVVYAVFGASGVGERVRASASAKQD